MYSVLPCNKFLPSSALWIGQQTGPVAEAVNCGFMAIGPTVDLGCQFDILRWTGLFVQQLALRSVVRD